jgi:hypothetical protein
MADRYWVGGAGTWDATTTTNWSATSGGAGGASAPTSSDNVIFDSLSNATLYTVTVGTNAVCNDLTAAGPLTGNVTFSLGATAVINCYGSMTLPASNLTWTATSGALVTFRATTTGKTITTNGVSISATTFTFDGVGGGWTLGSALTISGSGILFTNGNFDSGNYNISCGGIASNNTNIRSIVLGSSALTFTGTAAVTLTTTTNLTWNAGTSTISCSGASPTFTGGGLTFYNVSFTSAANGTTTITGANTFNNLTQTSRSATGRRVLTLGANQTVSGTLTLGASNTAVRRIQVFSDVIGTQRTITLNGALAALADIDFRDINAAGTVATPWTGTRLGNCLGNANITFDAPKTVYWNLAGTQNWSATGWATTNNGVPAVNNFPLAQDTATFTEAGAAGTITIDTLWNIGAIQMADGVSNRTTAFTLTSTSSCFVYKNITLFSNLISSGTAIFQLSGQGTTQTITSAGVSLTQQFTIDSPSGTVQLLDNLTTNNTILLSAGTLDLSSGNRTLTCNIFSSSNSNTRSILFGTGNITLTGNAATIWNAGTATGFTYTGTPTVNATYAGSTGTRTLSMNSTGGTESNVLNFNISAGSDIVTINTNSQLKNLNFTGFSGTLTSAVRTIYGNLTFSATMTATGGAGGTITFAATSGTQLVTTNGLLYDSPMTQNGVGGTVQLQDNLTLGANRAYTLTNGTLDLSSGNRTLSCGTFTSSNSNTRAIAFGTGEIVVAGNSTTVWNTSIATNFSYTGTPTVNFNYSGSTGARVINAGLTTTGGTESNALNFNISAGSDTVTTVTNSTFKNFILTGFSGTLSIATRTIYGNLIIPAGVTIGAGTNITSFAATSGTQQVTTNGVTLDFPITINGVGGTLELQDALTMGSTRALNLTNGTFTTNNYNVTTGRIALNAGTRVLNMGSSQFTLTGTSDTTTSWNITDSTNLTINAGTSTINLAEPFSAGGKQNFVGGGFTYYNLNFSGGQDCELYGNNTFNNISNSFSPVTIKFEAGTTQTVNNFTVSGTPSDLINLESLTPGSVWYLTKTSGTVTVTYCDISDSDANGGATFNCINGVNSGNNTGWNFSSSQFSSGNFLAFF